MFCINGAELVKLCTLVLGVLVEVLVDVLGSGILELIQPEVGYLQNPATVDYTVR